MAILYFSDIYRNDIKEDGAVSEQSYAVFLGGMQKTTLHTEVAAGLTVSSFGRQAGITFSGSIVEYQLSEVEDLKIISLLIQPSTEKKYECICVKDRNKLPMHIYKGSTSYTLERLSQVCPCNLNFCKYLKSQ